MSSESPHTESQRIDELEERVAELEALLKETDTPTIKSGDEKHDEWYDPTLNGRQRSIINGIDRKYDVGQNLGLSSLRDAVRANSDVSNKKKVRDYVEMIAESAHFEQARGRSWIYTGGATDE